MKHLRQYLTLAVAGLVATLATGCSSSAPEEHSDTAGAATTLAGGAGLTAYDNPYGDGSRNPLDHAFAAAFAIVMTAQDVADGIAKAPSTETRLTVAGGPATTNFLAHVHVGDCQSPGGHYMDASGGEIHLDFSTDAGGSAHTDETVAFAVESGKARSVVIHDSVRKDASKKPVKLGCIGLAF